MTSHLLDRLARDAPKLASPGDCVFCDIIARRQDAHIVAESADYVAFLDVLPIRTGKSPLTRAYASRAQGALRTHRSSDARTSLWCDAGRDRRFTRHGDRFVFAYALTSLWVWRAAGRGEPGICADCGPRTLSRGTCSLCSRVF